MCILVNIATNKYKIKSYSPFHGNYDVQNYTIMLKETSDVLTVQTNDIQSKVGAASPSESPEFTPIYLLGFVLFFLPLLSFESRIKLYIYIAETLTQHC